MTEEFLHFLWGNRLCYQSGLKTVSGEEIEIIHPGIPNFDAGPDFFNAKIRIGETMWAGNVEIHVREKEWYVHGHQEDSTYDNVILHVVQERNHGTVNSKGNKIPVMEMKYSDHLLYNYNSLLSKKSFVSCEEHLSEISLFEFEQWLERVLIEKIEAKSHDIERYLTFANGNWNEVFYILLARSFGFGVNGEPFEMLARSLPFRILLKHSDDLLQLEALLLGQAGLLEEGKGDDEYIGRLSSEYKFLSHKYGLKSLDRGIWRFLRLRPSNFPTIRIVQFAMLLHKFHGSFDSLVIDPELKSMEKMLEVDVSEYWESHYRPGKRSAKMSEKVLGINSARRIIANSIVPYIYVFAKKKGNDELQDKALDILAALPPEKNSIVNMWEEKVFKAKDEGQAQALIYLKNYYCNHKKCLSCRIGRKIIVSSK